MNITALRRRFKKKITIKGGKGADEKAKGMKKKKRRRSLMRSYKSKKQKC